jgi:hypothetical protein
MAIVSWWYPNSWLWKVMWIRDVYTRSRIRIFPFRIPRSQIQIQKDSGFRIRIKEKEVKYFNSKIVSKLLEIWCGMFIPDSDLDPGSRGQKVIGSRIRIRNTHCRVLCRVLLDKLCICVLYVCLWVVRPLSLIILLCHWPSHKLEVSE